MRDNPLFIIVNSMENYPPQLDIPKDGSIKLGDGKMFLNGVEVGTVTNAILGDSETYIRDSVFPNLYKKSNSKP